MVNTMKPLIRRTFCPKYGTAFGFAGQFSFHIRSCIGMNYHSKHKCKYCPMTFPKNNRALKTHENKCKIYAYANRKLKDEARETAKPKTKTGKSGTGPDFVLDDGCVCLCVCARETLLAAVLALSAKLTSVFGAAKETPQAVV